MLSGVRLEVCCCHVSVQAGKVVMLLSCLSSQVGCTTVLSLWEMEQPESQWQSTISGDQSRWNPQVVRAGTFWAGVLTSQFFIQALNMVLLTAITKNCFLCQFKCCINVLFSIMSLFRIISAAKILVYLLHCIKLRYIFDCGFGLSLCESA